MCDGSLSVSQNAARLVYSPQQDTQTADSAGVIEFFKYLWLITQILRFRNMPDTYGYEGELEEGERAEYAISMF